LLAAILTVSLLAAAFGLLLGYASIRFKVEADPIVDQVDAILPQTQCGQCGFAGCRPYAEAIASGEAEINRCPPGGEVTIVALADLLGRDVIPLDEEVGDERPPSVAIIDEQTCIGCTLCIKACPVDAIVETRIHEYHMESPGENIMTKDKLLAVGDKYEAMISADKAADAPYR